ncbi:MAG: glycosyltransferase [Bacilli bacterium]|nr:glycosyltransferase [Bacilli bacterium]
MSIDIICPLYNAECYIENLYNSLIMQENVNIKNILFLLTESKDKSLDILKSKKLKYKLIKKERFSHSLTREESALESKSDIIVFISQDVVIEDKLWLYNLTKNIGKDKIAGAYSRQITKYNNIEKYTREANYPDKSFIKSKKDIKTLGLKTFFFSDASSAVDAKVFKKLKGYDHKNLPINEDMYYAYKLITNGYKISYEAESVVYHSHNFTLKQIYDRYKLTGKFFKENSYLDKYGTTGSGASLAKYVLKRILKEHNIKMLFRYPFDMAARLFGMKAGKR